MALFKSYKPAQAKTSRTVTLFAGVFLILWGGLAAITNAREVSSALALPLNRLFDDKLLEEQGWTVDLIVLNADVSLAFVGVAVGVLLALWWWQRFLNTERWAELLIEMETELRKVSWPTPSDAWQSTLVVTGCTLTIVVLIFAYDVVIQGFLSLFSRGIDV